MASKFEVGKKYNTLDGEIIEVIGRKRNTIQYVLNGKKHKATVVNHCFDERNLQARITSRLDLEKIQ